MAPSLTETLTQASNEVQDRISTLKLRGDTPAAEAKAEASQATVDVRTSLSALC